MWRENNRIVIKKKTAGSTPNDYFATLTSIALYTYRILYCSRRALYNNGPIGEIQRWFFFLKLFFGIRIAGRRAKPINPRASHIFKYIYFFFFCWHFEGRNANIFDFNKRSTVRAWIQGADGDMTALNVNGMVPGVVIKQSTGPASRRVRPHRTDSAAPDSFPIRYGPVGPESDGKQRKSCTLLSDRIGDKRLVRTRY